jgi:hypothetical protein
MNARVRLAFPDELVGQPIVAQLVKRFDVEPNIVTASVGTGEGWVVCELNGEPADVEGAVGGSPRSASASNTWGTPHRVDLSSKTAGRGPGQASPR